MSIATSFLSAWLRALVRRRYSRVSSRRTPPPVAGTATSWERLSPSLQRWKRHRMSWFRRSSFWLDSSATVAGAFSVTPRCRLRRSH